MWHFYIDTGGTFTDCLAQDPDGELHQIKVLSSGVLKGLITRKISDHLYAFSSPWKYDSRLLAGYSLRVGNRTSKLISVDYKSGTLTLEDNLPAVKDKPFELSSHEEAPVLCIRLLTQTPLGASFPDLDLRLGTTKATNALLEKKGAKTALIVTQGFKDLLYIGTQQRPSLFQLNIPEPTLLYAGVFEIQERTTPDGQQIHKPSLEQVQELAIALKAEGYESVAISLLNAYKAPDNENELATYLFERTDLPIQTSCAVSATINYLRRTQTTLINAYLTPILARYFEGIANSLSLNEYGVMSSTGALVSQLKIQAKDCLLSGPAGGVTAAYRLGKQFGFKKLLTFDMGGTSTDVCRIEGVPALRYATRIGDAEVALPSLAIETVAAGGGSCCWFDGFKLRVGPDSAGASPGPACYGAGGPLTITDVNLLLGKLDPGLFSIPIYIEKAQEALLQLQAEIAQTTGEEIEAGKLLLGLERIVNEKMAEAIRLVSTQVGQDPRDYTLLIFGGAGGLHGCQLADILGITNVIVPQTAGIFSAAGIGQAQKAAIRTRQLLRSWKEVSNTVKEVIETLIEEASKQLIEAGSADTEVSFVHLFLRLAGQESTLGVEWNFGDKQQAVELAFKRRYEEQYGYFPNQRTIEIESITVQVKEKELPQAVSSLATQGTPITSTYTQTSVITQATYPVFDWTILSPNDSVQGPALILHPTSSVFLPERWEATVQSSLDLLLSKGSSFPSAEVTFEETIELELFTNRFNYIAEEMGTQLQRTAFSVNVKERLDFSCAICDTQGELIANAPHIPVHLGSLGVCTRLVTEKYPLGPGDVLMTNHPKYGGSHLPDITLLSAVYDASNTHLGYVINRAHHAEVGGKSPGSMPPDAQTLEEEGVSILPTYLVKDGVLKWESVKDLFLTARYPTRSWAENEADISAALSSLKRGSVLLQQLAESVGIEKVAHFMKAIKENAAGNLALALAPYQNQKKYKAIEYLDDGHRIAVSIYWREADGMFVIDFSGTSGRHPNNLNANISIVYSAVLYVLRLLVDKDIPLNDGLMQQVEILLPDNTLLHPHFEEEAAECPAVVGGNTELSQRLVDTLLKALGLAACSQGTMNNFLFGNEQFGYYETIGGGAGAGHGFRGRSAVHQHMTNTKLTDPEELERRYPIRVTELGIRAQSGGKGTYCGGDGIVREVEFLDTLQVTLLGQHRYFAPYGLEGGSRGKTAEHTLYSPDGQVTRLPGICAFEAKPNDRLRIETPGGGGFGTPPSEIS